ncbi:prostate-associated microseminoprotein [Scyliorhinus canicula]|uniref:prostate-associated microseminoprotein n=1 Tax=Scyliorhinus canicula TaxID=7830 RepID=UPI0018F4BDAC|nr:prostate-associated microseminoprotein [Scyliorhinus canicula]
MKQRWFIFFVLLGLIIPKSEAECYWITNDKCQFLGIHYNVGESWKTNDCFHCICMEKNKVICCDMVNYSSDFGHHCDVWYDAKTCQLSLLCGRSLKKT